MLAETWQRLRTAYDAVLDAPESERQRLIEEFCGSHPELGDELVKLLEAEARPDRSLDRPVVRLLPPPLAPGMLLAGRFRLDRSIGHGGMGEVWSARDETLKEDIAIKTIRALDADAQLRRRFITETQLARRISHPNVCRVNDFFEDTSVVPPRAFLTMALLDGETLAARLKRAGRMSRNDTLGIVRQLLAGLGAAHAAGVVHRDLKPANVMLTDGTDAPRAVIMDFGLARDPGGHDTDSMTAPGLLVGTPEYMAPEQISGEPVTPATDIYAMGLILFEMLSGSRPFAGGSTLASWMRRVREAPPRLQGVVTGVDDRIDTVIARCLAYSPADRYQTADQMREALETPRLVVAVPRSRRLWIAAAVTLAVAATLAAATAWRYVRAPLPPAEALQWLSDARAALSEGAAVRALNEVNRAIGLGPGFAPSFAALAEIRLELDMPARAQEAMLRASELARAGRLPDEYAEYVQGLQALVLRDCDQAIAALRRVTLASAPELRAYRMVSTARAMERCDRPDDATAILKEAALVDPRNAAVPLRLARLAANQRDYRTAAAALDAAERLFEDRNNVEGRGEVLTLRGTLQAEQDLLDEAAATLARANDIARSLGDVRQEVRAGIQQAVVARKGGNILEATRQTDAMLQLARQRDLETVALEGLFAAGNAHVIRSEFAQAQILFERALTIADTYRHDGHRARAWLSLATVFVPLSQTDRALKAIATARPYYERTRQVRLLATADLLAGQIKLAQTAYVDAIRDFTAARDAARVAGDEEQEARALENLATALGRTAHYGDAVALYQQLEERFRSSKQQRRELLARLNTVDLLSRMGRLAEARRELTSVRRDVTIDQQLASRIARIEGGLALHAGDYPAARAAARMVLESRDAVPPERLIRARLIACAAAAHLRRHQEAARHCDTALAESLNEDRILWSEARLVSAAAKWQAGDIIGARALLAELVPHFSTARETEEMWKFLALSARTAESPESRDALHRQLTRELSALRLKWKDEAFEIWRTRADVAGFLGSVAN